MVRHLLRTTGGASILVLCLISLPGQALAQAGLGGLGGAGVLNDPFTFYYAVYLPNQQLQSMRPTPMDSINNAMVTRQYYTQSDRQGLYNPISAYADQNYDPLHPYSRQQGGSARQGRISSLVIHRTRAEPVRRSTTVEPLNTFLASELEEAEMPMCTPGAVRHAQWAITRGAALAWARAVAWVAWVAWAAWAAGWVGWVAWAAAWAVWA